MKFRVQSYTNLGSWKSRALPFLKKEEGWNNLFWQILRVYEKSLKKSRAVNVFCAGKVELSAMTTPSGYLLLSHGSMDSVEALANYIKVKQWKFCGISGPQKKIWYLLSLLGKRPQNETASSIREFKIFLSDLPPPFKQDKYQLCPVTSLDWPRARIWAQQFALESDPPIDLTGVTQMAKDMQSSNHLFFLKNQQNIPCAMAGFGRSTDRYQVINMVYVPKNYRNKGIAKYLIKYMLKASQSLGYEKCLLFSEWKGKRNLYDSLGFRSLGVFVEYDLG